MGSASSDRGDSTAEPGDTYLESIFSDDDEFITGAVPSLIESAAEFRDCNGSEDISAPQAPSPVEEETHPAEVIEPEADDEEEVPLPLKSTGRVRRRRKFRRDPLFMARFVCSMLPSWSALATARPAIEHVDDNGLEALQQIVGPEPGKTVVPPAEIRQAVGPDLDSWILAAQVEHDSFLTREAVQVATQEERKRYGKRPLPMLNVWSRAEDDHRKCRSCIAGNFQHFDPAAQRWTAQAEPSSIFISAMLAAMRVWVMSKLDA